MGLLIAILALIYAAQILTLLWSLNDIWKRPHTKRQVHLYLIPFFPHAYAAWRFLIDAYTEYKALK